MSHKCSLCEYSLAALVFAAWQSKWASFKRNYSGHVHHNEDVRQSIILTFRKITKHCGT